MRTLWPAAKLRIRQPLGRTLEFTQGRHYSFAALDQEWDAMGNMLRLLPVLGLMACLSAYADGSVPAPTSAPSPASASAAEARAPTVQAIPASAIAEPAATPATPMHTCAEIKAFKDQLHKAIDAALKYPHAMSQHPVVGVTNIAYEYFDGKVRNVRITMHSGDEMLDRTALAAVMDADYTSISPRIDDEPIHDLVIIIFDNTGETDHEPMKKKARDQQDAAEACDH